jgi:RHH-type transcriptional regulator, rel operon repressor / antitoxin RelB
MEFSYRNVHTNISRSTEALLPIVMPYYGAIRKGVFAMDGVKETVSFRLDPSLKAALDEVGTALDRDRTWIINDALRAYLEVHHWQLKQIDQAIAGADRGEFATEEEIKAAFDAWRSE